MAKRKKKTRLKKLKSINKSMMQSSVWLNNKKMILFGLSMLCFVFLASTYAWFTSVDSRKNKFEGTRLIAEISEVFEPNPNWQPGTSTTKIVRVVNTGETPAIVRLSLYEFFLNFKVDNTDRVGNGNLIEAKEAKEPTVKEDDTDTWEPAAKENGTFTQGKRHFIANSAIVPDPEKGIGKYEPNSTTRPETDLAFITLNFSSYLKQTPPSDSEKDYWYFENGYFYYSETLKPGEETTQLLNSEALSGDVPNVFKGSMYKLKIFMDAHDTTPSVLKNWDVKKDGYSYQMIEKILKQANQ